MGNKPRAGRKVPEIGRSIAQTDRLCQGGIHPALPPGKAQHRVGGLGCREASPLEKVMATNVNFYDTAPEVNGGSVNDSRQGTGRREEFGLGGVQGNLNEPFPFAGSSFDVVIAGERLEHVFFPSFFPTEVARVLRPDGRFTGSTPNAFRLRNRWRFLLKQEFESDPTHLHRFSADSLERQLRQYFGRVLIEPLGGHFLGGGRSQRDSGPAGRPALGAVALCPRPLLDRRGSGCPAMTCALLGGQAEGDKRVA
jgi:SAM-dependent methyltransferase